MLPELQEEVDGSAWFFCLDAGASPWGGHREASVVGSRVGGVLTGGDRVPVGGPRTCRAPLVPGEPARRHAVAPIEILCSGDHGTLTDDNQTPDGSTGWLHWRCV